LPLVLFSNFFGTLGLSVFSEVKLNQFSNLIIGFQILRILILSPIFLSAKRMSKYSLILAVLFLGMLLSFLPAEAWAQCAMCKVTAEKGLAEGGKIGAGLNSGILYLASIPYLVFGTMAFLWYKNSKKEASKKVRRLNLPN
jgi:hypothetical protein